MWKHRLGRQGGIRKGHSSSRIETGEVSEGSEKDFCRYIEKSVKENVGLMQNQTEPSSKGQSLPWLLLSKSVLSRRL